MKYWYDDYDDDDDDYVGKDDDDDDDVGKDDGDNVQPSDSFSGPGVTHSASLLNVCQDLTMSAAATIFQFGFVQIRKCICKNLKMYLSKFENVFVKNWKYICKNLKMYLSRSYNVSGKNLPVWIFPNVDSNDLSWVELHIMCGV